MPPGEGSARPRARDRLLAGGCAGTAGPRNLPRSPLTSAPPTGCDCVETVVRRPGDRQRNRLHGVAEVESGACRRRRAGRRRRGQAPPRGRLGELEVGWPAIRSPPAGSPDERRGQALFGRGVDEIARTPNGARTGGQAHRAAVDDVRHTIPVPGLEAGRGRGWSGPPAGAKQIAGRVPSSAPVAFERRDRGICRAAVVKPCHGRPPPARRWSTDRSE